MRTPFYLRTLRADLDEWTGRGWVDSRSADEILDWASQQQSKISVLGLLAILGAVLLAMAAITFVAANWDGIPKLLRMCLLLAIMWAAFGAAALALRKQAQIYVHAFALLGAALFGAAIMLIAQTFNIEAQYPTGVLIWAVGAYATALIANTRPSLILTALLAGLWMHLSFVGKVPDFTPFWLWPALFLLIGTTAVRMKSAGSIHVLALSTIIYVFDVFDAVDASEIPALSMSCGVFAILALSGMLLKERDCHGSPIFIFWMTLAAMANGFLLQFTYEFGLERHGQFLDRNTILQGVLILALVLVLLFRQIYVKELKRWEAMLLFPGVVLIVASPVLVQHLPLLSYQLLHGGYFFAICVLLLVIGFNRQATGLIWVGGIGFVVQTLYVYFQTFHDLLDTSLFFMAGGALLLFISLGGRHFLKGYSGHQNTRHTKTSKTKARKTKIVASS